MKLSEVLDLQKTLVELIDSDLRSINMGNSKKKIDLDQIEKDLIKKEDQLVVLKEVVQGANKKKISLLEKTNNYYIYRMGNLKKRKFALIAMTGNTNKSNQWTDEVINTRIKDLNQDINKISNKLTTFNNSKMVKVEINPDLNLI